MTDREFWQQFYRHLKGMADAVKEMLDHEKSNTPEFIVPANVINEPDMDKIEGEIDSILSKIEYRDGEWRRL